MGREFSNNKKKDANIRKMVAIYSTDDFLKKFDYLGGLQNSPSWGKRLSGFLQDFFFFVKRGLRVLSLNSIVGGMFFSCHTHTHLFLQGCDWLLPGEVPCSKFTSSTPSDAPSRNTYSWSRPDPPVPPRPPAPRAFSFSASAGSVLPAVPVRPLPPFSLFYTANRQERKKKKNGPLINLTKHAHGHHPRISFNYLTFSPCIGEEAFK